MTSKLSNEDGLRELLLPLRNWERWGSTDQLGAINLVNPAKVQRSARVVQLGKTVSMARGLPKEPAANNPHPVEHFMRRNDRPDGSFGTATDYIALACHGTATTHLDALCHMWNRDGMWNGRNPDQEIGFGGARWGGIEHWSNGIVTRGVLLDIAANRPEGYVEIGTPVTGEELLAITEKKGLSFEPGDALVINCGREAWEAANRRPWSSKTADGLNDRPGLDASCLKFFHSIDCSMIIWDMMDVRPNEYGVDHSVHSVIFNQGVALVDNARLDTLASECGASGRSDFLAIVAPLNLEGGTGCPVNPIAIF